jgi:peptidoglycan/LPS O-acetylase OafA/YrhL
VLLALAGCTVWVARRRGAAVSEEALGFVVVGAAGLALLALAVLVLGAVSTVPGRAEGLALLGLGAYVVYLLAAWVMTRWLERRPPRPGPAPPAGSSFPPPDRPPTDPGSSATP